MADTPLSLLEKRIRMVLVGFVVGLLVSGVTAFPLPSEVNLLANWIGAHPGAAGIPGWIDHVNIGLAATQRDYPFLFYGTDWLAFAHLVIAALFLGPIRDPVRNVWVIQWGVFACLAVIPLALICGALRGIPFAWQLIDCSFGVVGLIPLLLCLRWIEQIERLRR